MATYKTPGVSIEEIAKLPPSVAEVETAIPAFIGYTQFQGRSGHALDNGVEVARISSLVEYVTLFGLSPVTISTDVTTATDGNVTVDVTIDELVNTMHYHLQLYFANGGGPCYIASVGVASGSVDASRLGAGLTAIGKYDEPTLIVFPEAVSLENTEAYGLYNDALDQCGKLKDRFVIMDCIGATDDVTLQDVTTTFRGGITSANLKYGAAYYPFIQTSLNYEFGDEAAIDVAIDGDPAVGLDTLVTVNSAAYQAVKAAVSAKRVTLNPSSAIAGVYAAVDSARGVWKAPANVSLNYVTGTDELISGTDQDGLNVDPTSGKSINVIRTFAGKGTIVWGARTLAGNDNEWRYISVRRFFNMVEESVAKATAAFVFEPNDANTWTKVQGMIENYLFTLWRAGALQGEKPEHAYYVSVGLGKTMTPQDILEGRMYVEIGMAAVRPAEFIVLRFSHMMAQS
jgi:phage tail sheath protein FI